MSINFRSNAAAFARSLERTPDAVAIQVLDPDGEPVRLRYRDLDYHARRMARQLDAWGIGRGDRIVISLPTCREFLFLYFATLLRGVVPVVIPAPRPKLPLEVYAATVRLLCMATQTKLAVCADSLVAQLSPHLPVRLVGTAAFTGDEGQERFDYDPAPEDIAHLQPTSGSTGVPRLAVVRHGNIAANVRGIGLAIRHRPGDVLLSWLPLFHDMGLIGVSYAQYWQCPLVMADPLQFARDPLMWPRMITRFGGTLSPAPNSAYKICARLAQRRTVEGIDLRSWRVALCGAEPVQAESLEHFQSVFGPMGFRRETMLPVYGLAEATLAASMPDPDEPPRTDTIDPVRLQTERRAVPAELERGVALVALGGPLPGHELRITNADGRELGEREVGEVQFRGPSVIDGYHGQSTGDPSLKSADGFLRTGDLGYLAGGQLYVTGRIKEIIITGGRNLVPAQLEAAVEGALQHGPPDAVAAVGVFNPATSTEAVHVVIESRTSPWPEAATEEERVRTQLEELFGVTGVTLHWVTRGFIPKTTSGKLMRYRCREKLMASARTAKDA